MSFLSSVLVQIWTHSISFVLLIAIGIFLSRCIYRIYLHPISHIPGPLLAKLSSLWLYYHSYIGDEASVIHALHGKYGDLLRVSPSQIDIADADAIQAIYVSGGGFPKSPCYANFDIDGHATLFSTTSATDRTPRAKAVVPMFSTNAIRSNVAAIYGCVDRMVARLETEAATGRPVNILNLTRSLAIDAVSTHLFRLDYGGLSEKGQGLSVSAFVDAFVAVGRFFYLPPSTFVWLDWAITKLMPDAHAETSMMVVDKFVTNLVDATRKEDTNFPGRLMAMGMEKSEVVAQCKDLIFAGTDSTGMNLATVCRQLTIHQDKLERLTAEIKANKASSEPAEIQSLPYLSGVVKESLRFSMANPTRLPHRVPTGGWSFKSTHIPAGTDVGLAPYELHFNEKAFPNPHAFMPERWLTEDAEARERMNKHWFAFGAGARACLARNLATTELYMTTERLAESGVLRGASIVQQEVEIYEWFNSCVVGEKMELVWRDRKV